MYGLGSVGSTMAKMLLERGASIVGAVIASESKHGKDVGELLGIEPLGVTATTDAQEALARDPDLVVMSIASYMDDMIDPVRACLKAGCDVISLSEELMHSWRTSPEETAEIDALAKEHGARMLCTGHQDGFWVSLPAVLMGTCFTIDEVRGSAAWNVDDFGAELARDQQVGASREEFDAWAATAQRPPTFGRTSLHALAAMAGLDVEESTTTTEPAVAEHDLHCAALGEDISAGTIIGFTDIDVVTTKQGVTLRLEMTGKVYAEGETDSNTWEVLGQAPVKIHSEGLQTHWTTCSTLVNRIPQLLEAEPGYRTIDELPQLRFRAGS